MTLMLLIRIAGGVWFIGYTHYSDCLRIACRFNIRIHNGLLAIGCVTVMVFVINRFPTKPGKRRCSPAMIFSGGDIGKQINQSGTPAS
jgi:hypothetical protein